MSADNGSGDSALDTKPPELILTVVVTRQKFHGKRGYQVFVRSNGDSLQEDMAVLGLAGRACEESLKEKSSNIVVVPGNALPKPKNP